MTASPRPSATPADRAIATTDQAAARTVTVADAIATAVLAVPGVTRLHGGSFGEVATYLPGRRVVGVRTDHEVTEVHVAVAAGEAVLEVADRVRSAVLPLVTTRVDVYLQDLDAPLPESLTLAPAPRPPASDVLAIPSNESAL